MALRARHQHVIGVVRRDGEQRYTRRGERSRHAREDSRLVPRQRTFEAQEAPTATRRDLLRHRGFAAHDRELVAGARHRPPAAAGRPRGRRVAGPEAADRHRLVGEDELEPSRLRAADHRRLVSLRSRSRSRNPRRCTLPVVVIGSASMNSISFGYSYGARNLRTCCRMSSSSAGLATSPGASTMNALTTLPRVSSGEGTTAAFAMARCRTRQFSISEGPMRYPAALNMSSARPWYQR